VRVYLNFRKLWEVNMGIRKSTGPDATQLVETALTEIQDATNILSPLGGEERAMEPEELLEPLPVYSVGLEELAGHELRPNLQPTSWRYLIWQGNEPVGTADVDADELIEEDSLAAFNHVSRGAPARLLNQALLLAEEEFEHSDEQFDLRILEIPALNRVALWLQSQDRQLFIPYIRPDLLTSDQPPRIEPDFLDALPDISDQTPDKGTPTEQ